MEFPGTIDLTANFGGWILKIMNDTCRSIFPNVNIPSNVSLDIVCTNPNHETYEIDGYFGDDKKFI